MLDDRHVSASGAEAAPIDGPADGHDDRDGSRPVDTTDAPRHHGATSEAADDDIDRLAAELEQILARKPRRNSPAIASADDAPDVDEAVPLPAGRRPFTSALRYMEPSRSSPTDPGEIDGSEADIYDDGTPILGSSGTWVARARRRRFVAGLRQAGSWVATMAIGSAIVAVAAAVLFATPKDLKAWQDYGIRALRLSAAESAEPPPRIPQGRLSQNEM